MTTLPAQDSVPIYSTEILPISSKTLSRQKAFWRDMLSSSQQKKETVLVLHLLESVSSIHTSLNLSSQDPKFQPWLNYVKENYFYVVKMISMLENFQFFGEEYWKEFSIAYNSLIFFNQKQYDQFNKYIESHADFDILKHFVDKLFYCKKQCPSIDESFIYDSPYVIESIIRDMKKRKEKQYGIYNISTEGNISLLECERKQIASYIKSNTEEAFFFGKPDNYFESVLFAHMK